MIQISNLLSFAGTLKSLGGVLLAIVILLAMVTIHEFGHYVAGKVLGFRINEFAVGFGPAIFKKRSKKTGELFALRVIPLGGYCAFDGEDEADDEADVAAQKTATGDEEEPFSEMQEKTGNSENAGGMSALNVEKTDESEAEITKNSDEEKDEYPEPKGERFNNQAPWKRIIVLIAGATMNYLLSLLLIICMFAFVGRSFYQAVLTPQTETITTSATLETLDEVLDSTEENADENAAETVGYQPLQTGDVVLKIDGEKMFLITDYMDALEGKKAGDTVELLVFREGKEQTLEMKLFADADFANLSDVQTLLQVMGFEKGQGLSPTTMKQGFFQTIGDAFLYSIKIGGTVLRSLGELLTGKLGMDAMGGPVTTIQVTSEAAASGLGSFLNIASFIGVNLAVFNLLPIPALDGCKVVFCLIEWIRRKPVNRKVEAIIHFVGIIVLFGFAILVDLLKLF